jgi:hypothetical protein
MPSSNATGIAATKARSTSHDSLEASPLTSDVHMDNFHTERLIIEIQSQPSLWDSTAIESANRDFKKRNWEELVEIIGGGDLSTVEKKELGKKCFYGFICGAAFQYDNLICKTFHL